MPPELSVVIPALNEAATLPVLLTQLRQQEHIALEVIVADGGSSDDTPQLALAHGARLVRAPKGRGAQMNVAARQATAPVLLFLHADSELTAPQQLRHALNALGAAGENAAGHFPLTFRRTRSGHELFWRYLQEKTALARPGTINGDQGLMLRAEFFRALGEYDERLPFLEDQRIAARIFEQGGWITFDTPLATSARRFEGEGEHRRYTLMALIMGLHAADAQEWFAQAPKVYAAHGEHAGALDVGAYLRLTWRVLIQAGPARALQILWRAGRYTRGNSWQIFFWIDAALRRRLRPGRYPFLKFHDAAIRPLLANPLGDALATALISAWFLLVLPVAYAGRVTR